FRLGFPPARGLLRRYDDPIRQHPDRRVRHLDQVPGLERRHGRAVAAEPDHVAGMQGQVARHAGDVVRDAEDHAARVVARDRPAVDAHLDLLVHRIDPLDDERPHRLERIRILRPPQGPVAPLPGALAHVVAQRVPGYAGQRFFFWNIPGQSVYDRHQLALEVHRPGRVPRYHDLGAAADEGIAGAVADVGL